VCVCVFLFVKVTEDAAEKVFIRKMFHHPTVWTAWDFQSGRANAAGASVFVYPEYPYSVELRQLGEQHAEQGAGVHQEVTCGVFGVETGQDIPAERRGAVSSSCALIMTICFCIS